MEPTLGRMPVLYTRCVARRGITQWPGVLVSVTAVVARSNESLFWAVGFDLEWSLCGRRVSPADQR